MTRYSVHPTAQRIPPPPRDANRRKNMPMTAAAASSAGILGVEKRYGKPWRSAVSANSLRPTALIDAKPLWREGRFQHRLNYLSYE